MFEIEAVVEIPKGSKYKYEMDKRTNQLSLDRVLPAPVPYNYGFIPCTLHEDGDPLDVCIRSAEPIVSMAKVKVQIIGALLCNDNGYSDHKLIGVLAGEPVDALVASMIISDANHYLSSYKEGFVVEQYVDADGARQILLKDMQAYQDD